MSNPNASEYVQSVDKKGNKKTTVIGVRKHDETGVYLRTVKEELDNKNKVIADKTKTIEKYYPNGALSPRKVDGVEVWDFISGED